MNINAYFWKSSNLCFVDGSFSEDQRGRFPLCESKVCSIFSVIKR